MNCLYRLLLLLSLLLPAFSLQSQNEVKDSLIRYISLEKNDTLRIAARKNLLEMVDGPEWEELNASVQKECRERIAYEKGKRLFYFKEVLAIVLNNEAIDLGRKGEREKARKIFEESIQLFKEIGNDLGVAKIYNNLAFNYNRQGNIGKALEIYGKAMVILRKNKQFNDLAQTLLNLGAIAYNQNQFQEAQTYLLEAEKILEAGTDEKMLSRCYLNISSNYRSVSDTANMFLYLNKAVKILERLGDKEGMGYAYHNLATYYKDKKQYAVAKVWVQKALYLRNDLKDKKSIASSLNNYAGILAGQGKWDSVKILLDRSYEMSTSLKSPELLQNTHEELYKYHLAQNDNSQALEHYKKYIVYRDSLQNDKNKKLSIKQNLESEFAKKEAMLMLEQEKMNILNREKLQRQQLQYDFERKQRELATTNEIREIALREELKRKQLMFENKSQQERIRAESDKKELSLQENIKRKELENRNQRTLTYFFILAFVLMGALAFFIFRGLQQNRKAKQIIEEQKEKVEEQNIYIREKQKEIVDSINYAKRLQEAILPPDNLLKQFLPEHFIFYKPKDIVAGDFYWMESAGDSLLVAAADCTGHGVPGAMVSLVCSNALNRTVKEFEITEPGKLLDKVRELVIETFEKSESEVKDGMDISLVSLQQHNGSTRIRWAGANNPLWIARNGATELMALKPDKQPIGKTDEPSPFHTTELELQKSDTLYLLTDGFADQFGGEKGKKLKTKPLQEFLLANSQLSMNQQKQKLGELLHSWKGPLEQVDDILIIGIRL